jgi:hypothetical protein
MSELDDTPQDWSQPECLDPEAAGEFVLAAGKTISKTAEQIENENRRDQMLPGVYLFRVAKIVAVKTQPYQVFYNGAKYTYNAPNIHFTLEVADNPKLKMEEFLVGTPATDTDQTLYLQGAPIKDGKPDPVMIAWHAKRFIQFLERLGYVWTPGGPLPNDALVLKNWIGRLIVAEVQGAKPYKDKAGVEKPGYAKVRPYSYALAADYQKALDHYNGKAAKSNGAAAYTAAQPQPVRQPSKTAADALDLL